MAETAVTLAIETLGTLLKDKIGFLRGVDDRVQTLQDELETMKCFLEDADRKQDEDALIRNWVAQVRDVSIDAEDAIELFIAKMESIKRKPSSIRFSYFPLKVYYLNKVGKEIESIHSRVKAIEANCQKYGIKRLGEGAHERAQELHLLRATVDYSQERNIVGIDEKVAFLVSQVLKEDCGRSVHSITGMGGIGKTTLARQIYNHSDLQTQFSCRAWICVSERYDFRGMMKAIIKQVESVTNDLLDKMEDADLKRMLHQCLKGKRYLVVLDDIWQEEGWDVLQGAFPDGGEGGRVLLTSRSKSVAQHAGSIIKPYELQTLTDEDGWELFTKKSFADGKCPSFLEGIGRQIMAKCGGLPLAITTIGRLLLRKKMLLGEWESVLHDINGHLSRGKNGVSAILELSYCDLSTELKFCFKYLGLFPEDHEISMKKLVRLWVAEGIAGKSEGSKCLEDIAESYLEQLINRNLVQVSRLTLDDKVKSFRLHDLLRDLAIRKGKEGNFLHIIASDHLDASGKSTHLAAHGCPFSNYLNPRVRTFLFVPNGQHYHGPLVGRIFNGVKILRVLDLDGLLIGYLPKEIGEMRLLRYLGLRRTAIAKLPHSLGRLRHLQYLVCGGIVELPRALLKLESLLYIDSYRVTFAGCRFLKLGGLKRLRRLLSMDYGQLMKSDILTLTNLQQLGIWITSDEEMDKLCILLSQLQSLSSLTLKFYCALEYSSLAGICKLDHLSELKMYGLEMGAFTALPPLPPNLSRLSLHNINLGDDTMAMLAAMKSLSFLKMSGAYEGERMTIRGFCQLNFLELTRLWGLKEISVEKDALSKLRCLRISACHRLKMLPEEFTSMTSLQKLELINMPKQFIERLQGSDSYKVSRIHTLNITPSVPPYSFYFDF